MHSNAKEDLGYTVNLMETAKLVNEVHLFKVTVLKKKFVEQMRAVHWENESTESEWMPDLLGRFTLLEGVSGIVGVIPETGELVRISKIDFLSYTVQKLAIKFSSGKAAKLTSSNRKEVSAHAQTMLRRIPKLFVD